MPAATSPRLARPALRVALAGIALVTVAGSASARDGRNAALMGGAALGVLGGVALGAALASPPPPPPRRIYVEEEPRPVYVRPVAVPVCHFERRKMWLNEIEYTYRRVEVCE